MKTLDIDCCITWICSYPCFCIIAIFYTESSVSMRFFNHYAWRFFFNLKVTSSLQASFHSLNINRCWYFNIVFWSYKVLQNSFRNIMILHSVVNVYCLLFIQWFVLCCVCLGSTGSRRWASGYLCPGSG